MSKDGGPAFPLFTPAWHEEVNQRCYEVADFTMGISARDYFAAKALQGLLATDLNCGPEYVQAIADSTYAMADAMLKARAA